MTNPDEQLVPSLLENASRGGDINEGGIAFQALVVMGHIPRWLAMDGFTAMIRESIFDAEAKFFVPGRDYIKEGIEVKDHSLTPSEFWNEIDRFIEVDQGSPLSYAWFTLASTGLSESLHPLRNGLRRLRDPYGFYYDDSTIFDNSYQQYVQIVLKQGRTEDIADFLFRRVLLQDDLSLNRTHGKAVFKHELNEWLPHHRDMPDRILEDIYAHLDTFLGSRRNRSIARMELENKLIEQVPAQYRLPRQSVRLFTAIDETNPSSHMLHFNWASFFYENGGEGSYPTSAIWNERLVSELQTTQAWILKHRDTRRIQLEGSRRLSTSVAIGFVFSAVKGFMIDMQYRGTIWSTDAHATADTPSYPLQIHGDYMISQGERLIVSVGICRNIAQNVDENRGQLGLGTMPALHIYGDQAIQSPHQLNSIVRDVKSAISQALTQTGARYIDLFLAGPAPLALFLGYRLNATAIVQCYEWVKPSQYVPTCTLT